MRHSISMPAARATSALGATQTNKVLRNTYLLLAITLLPTIVGAFVGALYPLMEALGWMSIIVFFGAMVGFQMMVIKNRHSIAGIWWLLAFTFVMGYFIGPLVGYALGAYSNGAQLVGIAVGGTAAIFFGLAGYATVTKRDFSGLSFGKTLFIGMWMLIAIGVINVFFQSSAIALAVSSCLSLSPQALFYSPSIALCVAVKITTSWRRWCFTLCCSTFSKVCCTC